MTALLRDFLQFLKLNRNASVHTVRAYGNDLAQFLECTARGAAVKTDELTPAHLDRQAIATILSAGSGRSYAAEVVAGGGFDLAGLAPFGGALLAKDVGILAEQAALTDSTLLAAADAALGRMGFVRTAGAR